MPFLQFILLLMMCLQAAVRRSSSYLIGYFFKNSKLYLVDEAPNMISTLIILLSDSDSSTVTVSAGVVDIIHRSSIQYIVIICFSLGCVGSFVKGHYFSTQGGAAFLYKTCP